MLAGALKDEGFTVVSTCPGWVATDMGTNPEIMKVRCARPRTETCPACGLHRGVPAGTVTILVT